MLPRFDFGCEVRVVRNVRNDGTFPGLETGDFLVRRGSTGFVRNVGTFLQDQIIYSVHFTDEDRLVGCREEELIAIDEPWTPSRFEFRDRVTPTLKLAVDGQVIAHPGDEGEVLKVLRGEQRVDYHVRFPGHTLQIPETSLAAFDETTTVSPPW